MAKLSTAFHACSVTYVDSQGVPTGQHCPRPAYRRVSGEWRCRTHLRKAS